MAWGGFRVECCRFLPIETLVCRGNSLGGSYGQNAGRPSWPWPRRSGRTPTARRGNLPFEWRTHRAPAPAFESVCRSRSTPGLSLTGEKSGFRAFPGTAAQTAASSLWASGAIFPKAACQAAGRTRGSPIPRRRRREQPMQRSKSRPRQFESGTLRRLGWRRRHSSSRAPNGGPRNWEIVMRRPDGASPAAQPPNATSFWNCQSRTKRRSQCSQHPSRSPIRFRIAEGGQTCSANC